jgi:hypothetical protein
MDDTNGESSSSPQIVQFGETPRPPFARINSSRLEKLAGSVTSATLSGESSVSFENKLEDCNDENCAFGWETYVLDHSCDPSTAKVELSNPKISIHKLLHQQKNNPLLREPEKGIIRHVHLPANNMKWVEVSSFKYHSRFKPTVYWSYRISFEDTIITKMNTSS